LDVAESEVFSKLGFVDEMAEVEEKSGVTKPCAKFTTLLPIPVAGTETRYTNLQN